RQPGTLQQRAGLVGVHPEPPPLLMSIKHWSQSCSVFGCRQPAGVTVCQYPEPLTDELLADLPNLTANRRILIADGPGFLEHDRLEFIQPSIAVLLGPGFHPVERPKKIHGRRPAARQVVTGVVQLLKERLLRGR